ncbi:unnamed protein product [Acanthoscelides obtectus]|uniref:Uncharacterized protein n=1 Tax=Acanthoscelides obtectus TaxID=200917 RepID=A0A9P0L5F7_ACAOB|nr:unnamed protein product [Acanthoscelides obtectus]CAK1642290.1 hypothetical protein AOBTE_LOCUS12955 [Acanthoscelides obtectus]
MTGVAPKDKRGENKNHPRKFDAHVLAAIYEHIKSFKGRKSHYSVKDSRKLYLPEDLIIKKMFKMFCELNPSMKVSYESYRTVFNTKFNIAFVYPRTDTCSSCDEFLIKIKSLQSDVLKSMDIAQKERFQKEIRHITIQNDVHKRKAEVFYSRKRAAKKRSRTSVTHEAICLDFGQNLSVPNITTNDVYYKSQLNVYAFNIHILSTAKITFPIRGHSYMEPDKNMGLINSHQRAEIPSDWVEIFRSARAKPSPFDVVEIDQSYLRAWTNFFNTKTDYLKKCPFRSRPIRELEIHQEHHRLIYYRESYNGAWESAIVKGKETKRKGPVLLQNEFVLPPYSYSGLIPITVFWGDEAKQFFDNLPKNWKYILY